MDHAAELMRRTLDVLEKYRRGSSMTKACREVGTTPSTVKNHRRQFAIIDEMFVDAEQEHHDALADLLLEIDNVDPSLPAGSQNPQMAGVLSKNIQWVLARRDKTRFGDRVTVETERADTLIIEALNLALQRIPVPALPNQPALIEATPTVIDVEPTITMADLLGDIK